MNSPGAFQLTKDGSAFQIVGPGTFEGDWSTGFEGVLAASFQAKLSYGSGGTSVVAYVQTSVDQGQTAIDVAAISFGAAGATKVVNLSGLTPKTTPVVPTQQALTADTSLDGVLGDRFRAVVVVTGTYAGSTVLNISGVAR